MFSVKAYLKMFDTNGVQQIQFLIKIKSTEFATFTTK